MPYIIGIDLGTTNCGVASVQVDAPVEQFPVQQLTNPGEVRPETLLPSFLYIPGSSDFPEGSTALPWNEAPPYVVGQLAQKRGSENAGRLVASAKSWLSHGGVDRTAALLPLTAPEGVPKISPVVASRAYLEHIRDAWNHACPDAPFDQQSILVTVPASFDA
ncbi:MAG TPA: Hsp70 family protein, partial [Bryobacteraceae bacterium]|nr:Hsp70 family protein [Bryobacteraceae bacterium]